METWGKTVVLKEMVTSQGPKPYPRGHNVLTLSFGKHILDRKCPLEDMANDIKKFIEKETS